MRQHGFKVSKNMVEFAAAAYDYVEEATSPAPDLRLRAQRREQMIEAERRLSTDDRLMLHGKGWRSNG